jgi:hypothetical protein
VSGARCLAERGSGDHLDGLLVELTERQVGAAQENTQRTLRRELPIQRRRLVPFSQLREEDDLNAALIGELLQGGPQWLRRDLDGIVRIWRLGCARPQRRGESQDNSHGHRAHEAIADRRRPADAHGPSSQHLVT